ncbi:MFS transporter [Roseovarius sp. MBR-6]|jgi:MFS family permease|uniref:MFS transporter n=1 Tax=Roseovarius sp. MBR-6 TaxID=3156459 RepID=UPI00339B6B4E
MPELGPGPVYDTGEEPGIAWTGVSDKRSYYRLFAGYVLALVATGAATVALALLAFDLAGDYSGAVIGTALSLKMLAYVLAAPVVTVLLEQLPRKAVLIALDLIRAACLLLLVLITEIWHIYALVFVFALASGTFSFVYMAVVPYLLGTEEDYTRSLSRSRIAAELEGPLSPLVAAGLLLVLAPKAALAVTAAAFLLSALLIRAAHLPPPTPRDNTHERVLRRVTRGPALFFAVPLFRAVVALDLAVAFAAAMVQVNTVVLVQGDFGLARDGSALAFGAFGLGAVLAAVVLPLLHKRYRDRSIMLAGLVILCVGLAAGTLQSSLPGLLVLWAFLGVGVSLALTPAIFLIRRLARPSDLLGLIAAQMSIASGCLLVAYSLAGWLGAELGMGATFAILAVLCAAATLAFIRLWPSQLARE